MPFVVSQGQVSGVAPSLAPWPSSALWLASDYSATYEQIYRSQPSVRTVVSFLARNVAQLGLHTYRRVSDVDRERLRDHSVALLLARPTPGVSRYRLIEALVSDLAIFDAAYWVKIKQTGVPGGLMRVPPTLITPVGDPLGQPEKFQLMLTSGVRELPADQVVYFHGYHPGDPRVGVSPLEAVRQLLSEEFEASRYRQGFWRNGARLSGVIERPGDAPDWSENARSRFTAEFNALYGPDGGQAGGVPVLEDGMSYKQVSGTAEQAQYIESRKLTREEVAAVYHIPPPMVGILDNANYCLPADALVETDRGPKAIVDVAAGDSVWSVVDGSLDLRTVTWSGQTGTLPLLTIKTQNRTLRCTANHPVLVRRRVPLRPGVTRYRWEHAFVPAGELQVGDILVTLQQLPDAGGDLAPTRSVSEGFMEFFGLLMGDGSVSGNVVAIGRASDARYMDHYRDVMRTEFVCCGRGNGRAETRGLAVPTLVEDPGMTRFTSVLAARELAELGFKNGSRTKRVPDWVFTLSDKLRLAFLRGYVEADGSVTKGGRIQFGASNKFLIEQMRHLCIGLGIPVTNIRESTRMTRMPDGRMAENYLVCFTASDPGKNRLIGSHDPQDAARLADGKPWGAKAYRYPERTGRVPIEPPDGCGHAKVVSIDIDETSVPVFDITVDGSHNFVADGVVVHNSNVKEFHSQLYSDTLGPILTMIQEELAVQLIPEFDKSGDIYVEFNIAEKLKGSFEEQAAVLQAAVGAPYLTRNEARARLNLPQIDGGDDLVTPMNVTEGGQASPQDVDVSDEGENALPPKSRLWVPRGLKARSGVVEVAPSRLVERQAALAEFFARQERSLLSAAGAGAELEALFGSRWDDELAALMLPLDMVTAKAAAELLVGRLGLDVSYDVARTEEWHAVHAGAAAVAVNAATFDQVAGRVAAAGSLKDAVREGFGYTKDVRTPMLAVQQEQHMSGWGAAEVLQQNDLGGTKTWRVRNAKPRQSHSAINGQTVPMDGEFSIGARWPGDSKLPARESANCTCTYDISLEG